MTAKQAWLDSDNKISLLLLDKRVVDDDNPDGTPIDFIDLGFVSMKLFRFDDDLLLASSEADEQITFNELGEIKISLGHLTTSEVAKSRSYSTYIKAYSQAEPRGQVIVHIKMPDSNLSITFN